MSTGGRPSPELLESLRPLLRQLREIKGVAEARPGVLQWRGKPLVAIVLAADGTTPIAEVVKPGGSGVDRLPLDTPAAQRKVVDDAKLRAKRLEDDA